MIPDELQKILAPPSRPTPSHDPNDILLGDTVHFSPEHYNDAGHVIIGCPQDIGVDRNHGRIGAARGPAEIRKRLYALKPPADRPDIRILDLGDIFTEADLETIHARLYSVVTRVLDDDKKVIVLGGGNDISLPDGKAVHAVHPIWSAVNVDAHLDMRMSEAVHSGTPYRDLIANNHLDPSRFHEAGIQPQANSYKYLMDAETLGVHVHTLNRIRRTGAARFFKTLFDSLDNTPLFAGLDMDAVRASDSPGVSAPSPTGLSAEDVLEFADCCGAYDRTAVFEVTETNPDFDRDGRTARLAALAVYVFLFGNR